MDKKIITIAIGIVLVMGIIMFFGNGVGEEDIDIYGTWIGRTRGIAISYEFREDGTFCSYDRGRHEFSGTWKMIGDEILFKYQGLVFAEGRVEDNTLTFRKNGEKIILTRP